MQIEHKDAYTLIDCKQTTVNEVIEHLLSNKKTYKTKNIILDFSKNINIKSQDFLLFLNIADNKTANSTSFVVIRHVNVDDFPENLNIVPTLQEAKDIIEMENIQRELGF